MRLFIVYSPTTGEYLTPRRSTGTAYMSRATWSTDWSLAKPFTKAAAATNSARQAGGTDFEVIEGYFKAKDKE
jgi:hypothetical protein